MGGIAAAKASTQGRESTGEGARSHERDQGRAPSSIESLHRILGNQGVGRLLTPGTGPGVVDIIGAMLEPGGQPLHPLARTEMEQRFGRDLGQVRVHTDHLAGQSAHALAARAFTLGDHIVFGHRQYSPSSAVGRLLLAHEVAHVIQQRRGGSSTAPAPDDQLEADARQATAALATSERIEVRGASGVTIARAPEGERATPEEIRAYQLLRQIEESAHIESGEMEERAVEKALPKRKAAEAARVKREQAKQDQEAKKARKPAEKVEPRTDDELRRLIASRSTAGVSYFVDDDGRLHKVVSGSGGRRRDLEFEGGTWVGAQGAKASSERHAETNTIRNAQATVAVAQETQEHPPHLVMVTSGASRPHCARCAEKIRAAGGTTASPVNEPEKKQIGPGVFVRPARPRPQEFGQAMEGLQRVPAAPPPKAPEVTYKPPLTAGGGVPAPPASQQTPPAQVAAKAAPPAEVAPAAATAESTTVDRSKQTGGTQGAGPVVTKTTTPSFKGIAHTTKQVEMEGDRGKVTTFGTAMKRDAGKLGAKQSTRTQTGQFNAQQKQIKGRDTTVYKEGGAIFGPGGAGASGGLGGETKQIHGNGYSTGQSIGAHGQFTVDVKPVEGKTPPQFQVVLTVSLGANVGVSAGAEKGGASGSVSAGLSGSVTGTFAHTFSAAEKEKYLSSLNNHSASAAKDELDVVRLAAGGSLDEAKALLTTLQAGALTADAIKRLQEGDSAQLEAQGRGELGLGVSAQGKAFGGKVDVSFSKSGSLKRKVVRKGGKAIVTVEVVAGTGSNIGGAVSAHSVRVGVSRAKNEDVGHTVEFELDLDPKDPVLEQRLGQIRAADTADQLRALEAADPAMVASTTESKADSTTWTPTVGAAGAELAISDTSEYGESTTKTRSGTSKTFTGGHGVGVSIGAQEGPKASYSEIDRVGTTVGPTNRAAGDASTSTTQTDLTGSLLAIGEGFENKPVATTAGLATGGQPLLHSKTEVVGMKLSDSDYDRIAMASLDNHAWTQGFIDSGMYVRELGDAQELQSKIAAANGNRENIARALAVFARDNDKAAHLVQAIVRPAGTAEGGVRYDFPADMRAQQADYDNLVAADPLEHPGVLADSGKVKEAIDELNEDIAKLKSLFSKIERYRDKFTDDAAVAEMMNRIGDREIEIRAEVRALTPRLPAPSPAATSGAKHPPELKSPKSAALDHQAAVQQELSERIGPLVHACINNRYAEQAAFADIDSEYGHWYRKADIAHISGRLTYMRDHLYVEWDQSVAKLKEIDQARGKDPGRDNQFAPDRAAWTQRYNRMLKI